MIKDGVIFDTRQIREATPAAGAEEYDISGYSPLIALNFEAANGWWMSARHQPFVQVQVCKRNEGRSKDETLWRGLIYRFLDGFLIKDGREFESNFSLGSSDLLLNRFSTNRMESKWDHRMV